MSNSPTNPSESPPSGTEVERLLDAFRDTAIKWWNAPIGRMDAAKVEVAAARTALLSKYREMEAECNGFKTDAEALAHEQIRLQSLLSEAQARQLTAEEAQSILDQPVAFMGPKLAPELIAKLRASLPTPTSKT